MLGKFEIAIAGLACPRRSGGGVQKYNLLRIRHWQIPQDHSVHHAENRRVRADTQGEHQDHNGREQRTSPKGSQREFQIWKQT
jgi:hypothetical protein